MQLKKFLHVPFLVLLELLQTLIPKVESYVAKKLNLKVEPISTQIIPRDRHAYYFSTLGIIAGSIERVATEIRNLTKN